MYWRESIYLFNYSHVLHLRSQTVAVRRRINMVWMTNVGNVLLGNKIILPKFPGNYLILEEKTSTTQVTQPGIEPGPAE